MKKSTKSFIAVAMVALTCGFFAFQSSSEMVSGNVEALTEAEVSFGKLKAFTPDGSSTVKRPTGNSTDLCNIIKANTVQTGTCLEIVVRP